MKLPALVETLPSELRTPVIQAAFWRPVFLERSPWQPHVPFAFWLMEAMRPRNTVEVGTADGTSYFAFCQAVDRLGLDARCTSVSNAHTARARRNESASLIDKIRDHNNEHYSTFSKLIESEPEDASALFSDASIDVLHLCVECDEQDYERLKEAWLPKLSDRGVLLLHHTKSSHAGSAAAQIYQQLRIGRPAFEFSFGDGLGVVGIGTHLTERLENFFRSCESESERHMLVEAFGRLGRACIDAAESKNYRDQAKAFGDQVTKYKLELDELRILGEKAQAALLEKSAELVQLHERVESMGEQHALERGHLAERISFLHALREETKGTFDRLSSDMQAKSGELEQYKASLAEQAATQFAELKAEIGKREELVQELRDALADSQEQLADLNEALNAANLRQRAAEARADAADDHAGTAEDRAEAAQEMAIAAEDRAQSAAARASAAEERAAAAEASASAAKGQVDAANARADSARNLAEAADVRARTALARAEAAEARAYVAEGRAESAEGRAFAAEGHAEMAEARVTAALAEAARADSERLRQIAALNEERTRLALQLDAERDSGVERDSLISSLRENIEAVRAGTVALERQAERQEEEHRRHLEAILAQNDEMKAANEAHQRDAADRLASSESRVQAISKELDSLRIEADSLTRELSDRFNEIAQLTQLLLDRDSSVSMQEAAIGHLQAENSALKSSLQLQAERFAADLAQANDRIKLLDSDARLHSLQHSALAQALDAAKKEVAELSGQMSERFREIADLTRLLEQERESAADLRGQAEKRKLEIEFLRAYQTRRTDPEAKAGIFGGWGKWGSRKGPPKAERRIIEESGLFDPTWYRTKYPDVAGHVGDLLEHYLSLGWKEGKDPGPNFNTQAYWGANPEAAKAGLNPLVHYLCAAPEQRRT
jgi:hypothetical protein